MSRKFMFNMFIANMLLFSLFMFNMFMFSMYICLECLFIPSLVIIMLTPENNSLAGICLSIACLVSNTNLYMRRL